MIRLFPLLSLATVLLACRPIPIAARRWIGCYEMTVGQWIRDSLQSHGPTALPHTIALRGSVAVFLTDTIGYQLEPQIFDPERRGVRSAWQVTNDTVHLTWSDGFSGVWLWFSTSDSGFVGRAESFTDVQRAQVRRDRTVRTIPSPTAPVRLRSICYCSFAAA